MTLPRLRFLLPLALLVACSSAEPASVSPPDTTTTPPPPPPPPPPSTAQILLEEGFEDNAFAARGWYDGGTMVGTTAEKHSGTRSLLVDFPTGALTPSWGLNRHLFTGTETVYIRYWVKYSSNWVGSGQPYHPHEFYLLTNEDPAYIGPAFTHLTAYIEHNYQNGGFASVAIQDGMNIDTTRINQDLTNVTENRAVAGCNGSTDGYPGDCYRAGISHYNGKTWRSTSAVFQQNPGTNYKGDWNLVEAYFQLNTISNGKGVADGIIRYWLNGTPIINLTNVLMRTGTHSAMRFNQLIIGPYIGPGSPVNQTMWVDDLQIATAKP